MYVEKFLKCGILFESCALHNFVIDRTFLTTALNQGKLKTDKYISPSNTWGITEQIIAASTSLRIMGQIFGILRGK